MTMQVLLSMVFGFGVVTLATVALLNAAGHRLFELQVLSRRGEDFSFVYTYNSEADAELRLAFSRLPLRLGGAAIVVVLLTYGLFFWSTVSASTQAPVPVAVVEGVARQSAIGTIAWAAIGMYVMALVVVTTSLSARLYSAISTFRSDPLPRQSALYRGSVKLSEDGPHIPRTFRYAVDVRATSQE